MYDVILHAFDWRYKDNEVNAQRIGDMGFGAVLFPPPLYSDENGQEWWQRYQPRDYRVIRSYLGRKADLKRAVDALKKCGVRAYADVVFNHMANENRRDRFNFPGEAVLQRYSSAEEGAGFKDDCLYGNLNEGLFSPDEFNKLGEIKNYNDPWEVEEGSLGGLPDLEFCDKVVQQQRECLSALNGLGFSGYRIDALKHLPVAHLEAVFETEGMQDKFVFGEVLTFNDNQEATFLWPVMKTTDFPCYDFVLQETLRKAFAPSGSMRELGGPRRLRSGPALVPGGDGGRHP
jgi:Glycosidases